MQEDEGGFYGRRPHIHTPSEIDHEHSFHGSSRRSAGPGCLERHYHTIRDLRTPIQTGVQAGRDNRS